MGEYIVEFAKYNDVELSLLTPSAYEQWVNRSNLEDEFRKHTGKTEPTPRDLVQA